MSESPASEMTTTPAPAPAPASSAAPAAEHGEPAHEQGAAQGKKAQAGEKAQPTPAEKAPAAPKLTADERAAEKAGAPKPAAEKAEKRPAPAPAETGEKKSAPAPAPAEAEKAPAAPEAAAQGDAKPARPRPPRPPVRAARAPAQAATAAPAAAAPEAAPAGEAAQQGSASDDAPAAQAPQRPSRARRTRKGGANAAANASDAAAQPTPSAEGASTAGAPTELARRAPEPAPTLAPAPKGEDAPAPAARPSAAPASAESPASAGQSPDAPAPSAAPEAPSADGDAASAGKAARSRRTRSSQALPTDAAELAKMGISMTPEIAAALKALPRRRRGRPSNEELQARKVLEEAVRQQRERTSSDGATGEPRAASDTRAGQEPSAVSEAAPASSARAQTRPEGDAPAQERPTEGQAGGADEGAAGGASGERTQASGREEGGFQRRNHRKQDGAFVPRHQRNQQQRGEAGQQGGQRDANRDNRDSRDNRNRDNRDGRDNRDARDNRDNRNGGQQQGGNRQRQQDGRDNRQDRYADRRQQRRDNRTREVVAPKANREELAELKVAELRTKATELGIDDAASLKKPELVEAVYSALVKQEGFFDCAGVLDIMQEGYGFIRTKGYLPSEGDVYVGAQVIRSNGLRRGDWLVGIGHASRPNDKYPALNRLESVNGRLPEEMRNRPRFADLTPVFPDERLRMEHGKDSILGRCIDLVAPIGKGQRGLIVSPPKAGKTTVLKKIAESIAANNPEVHLICLLVDERPEEVTDMQRSIKGEVVASTFDMPCDNHITVSELVIERAKRLVELGEDVVILLDSITRLARAYNLAQPASGRILSGGVDSTALYPPKRFLGAARNIEGGGSLTILASALVETGSKMDEVIFEEFKGTGNMELRLDRDLADRRIFPAIDPVASGTRKEELLLDPGIAPFVWGIRRILANMNNNERAMSSLIKSLKATATNEEFLIRSAKKAQNQEIGADLQ